MIIRKAKIEELDVCFDIILDAKEYQKNHGFIQWDENYPLKEDIKKDINDENAYVFIEEEKYVGYCCIIYGEEKDYKKIDGLWITNEKYAVVHRLAFSKQYVNKGYSKYAFDNIKSECIKNNYNVVRIDTHEENKIMQHILERENFKYCGIVYLGGVDKRLAYEWFNK